MDGCSGDELWFHCRDEGLGMLGCLGMDVMYRLELRCLLVVIIMRLLNVIVACS